MKTSKIKKIVSCHSFDGQYGTSWDYKIELENWDTGSLIKKTENAVKEWDELTYEIKETDYWPRIREVKQYRGKWNSDNVTIICKAMELTIQMLINKEIDSTNLQVCFDRLYDIMSKKNG